MVKGTKDKALNFENEFATRLNELTGELKQEAIADATHCTRQSVSNYINGKRIPDAQFVWDFLHTVNDEYKEMGYGEIDANYLFGFSDIMFYDGDRIDNGHHLSNSSILTIKNISKSKVRLKAFDILIQNKGFVDFLEDIYTYIFIKENDLNKNLDKKTIKSLREFNLTKLTHGFLSNLFNDIHNNDMLIENYKRYLTKIDLYEKFLNGEIENIENDTDYTSRQLYLLYLEKGKEGVQQELQRLKEQLEAYKHKELKNLKRIYNDRYNIKIDSNE